MGFFPSCFAMMCNTVGARQHRFLLYSMTLNATVPCHPRGCNAAAVAEGHLKELFVS